MSGRHEPRRAVAAAAVLLGMLAALHPGAAAAGVGGRAAASQSVATGSWAVVPTTLATPVPGPLALTFAAVLSPPAQYFDAANTGSVAVTAASYSVTVTGGGLALGSPSITLATCSTAWNETTGTCSGTVTTIGTWNSSSSAAVASAAAPASPGSRLRIKASISFIGTLSLATVATVSVSISSGPTRQIRSATTTNA